MLKNQSFRCDINFLILIMNPIFFRSFFIGFQIFEIEEVENVGDDAEWYGLAVEKDAKLPEIAFATIFWLDFSLLQ